MLGMLRDPVAWFQGSVAMILSPVTMLLGRQRLGGYGSVISMGADLSWWFPQNGWSNGKSCEHLMNIL